jgi:hypothetical protein
MCGNVFCAACTPNKAKLPKELGYDKQDKPKRVCEPCFESTKAMNCVCLSKSSPNSLSTVTGGRLFSNQQRFEFEEEGRECGVVVRE